MQIKIFPQEIKDGLEQKIAKASIAYLQPISICLPEDVERLTNKVALAQVLDLSLATNKNQVDLHYVKTILATVGWNLNTDVFDPLEMWKARHTPEDKPINYEHNYEDIIGHITGSVVIDKDLQIIPDDTADDKIPPQFHIVTGGVLYKPDVSQHKDRSERIATLIAEINKGEWFVSMEALFAGFDYAVIKGGKSDIIERNDQTCHLTKYLRAYGGSGEYQGYSIGRLMRNIVFSGKGMVRNPANPDSIFVNDSTIVVASTDNFKNSTDFVYDNPNNNPKGKVMSEALEKQIEDLKKANATLETQLKAISEETVKATIAKADEKVKAVQTENDTLKAQIKSLSDANTQLVTKSNDLEKSLKTVQDEVKAAKAAQVKTERIHSLEAVGQKREEAEKIFAQFENLTDDQFKSIVALFKVKADETVVEPPVVTPEEKPEEVPVVTPEDVTPDQTATLASADKTGENLRAEFGAALGKLINRKNGKKVKKTEGNA